jgi:hypothetical protein
MKDLGCARLDGKRRQMKEGPRNEGLWHRQNLMPHQVGQKMEWTKG